MEMVHKNSSLKWILMAGLALVWGSSFILMKRALVDFLPDQVASIRMFASFLFLFPFVIGKSAKVKKGQWKFIFSTGFLGNGIPAFLFTYAQTKVPSFMAGMLNSLTPLFTMIMGYFIFKNKVSLSKILGVGVGLAGAVGLILLTSGGKIEDVSWYPMLIVLATICYAASVNIIRNKLHEVDSIVIAGFALFIVGPLTGIHLFMTDFLTRLSENPHAWVALGYVLLLALFGTAISVVVFNQLIKMSGALFASSVTYLIPIVAMLWGVADGEQMGVFHLAALAAILGGVYLINLKKPAQVAES
jgi:drug/metabolite transporter (DMT)-like permease